MGIDSLKNLYVGDLHFGEAFEVYTQMVGMYDTNFSNY